MAIEHGPDCDNAGFVEILTPLFTRKVKFGLKVYYAVNYKESAIVTESQDISTEIGKNHC
jgi:hypothetical protein